MKARVKEMAAKRRSSEPDTGEMVVVHRLFQQEYRTAVGLVEAVDAGDTRRSRTVASHLDALDSMLEEHHLAEDELVWPRLEGDPEVDPALLLRMEQQHERIAGSLGQVADVLPRWRDSADPALRDVLVKACTDLLPALDEHLADEERHILPLVPGRFTAEEWGRLSERGRDAVPKEYRLYMLGAMASAAGPEHYDEFLGRLPGPVRLLWRVAGKGLHRRARAGLHGTRSAGRA
ncbi:MULTISPECIES: hemerythrin domain-containing protein [unclassified Streptomyces]|uniref:hemerythrin domain-containing protein n=1 Tax=unclassified Streptomyces TaxID=2593676 RepID=UPI002259E1C2|nr:MULTISPECIES: hemerythrin domain-containing protein [unclassified Streptomyces]MCX5141920.1 hemerythrin domain-containing protein [Streptomyces sp. NBC_00338]WRZ66394.1 hemerythrin domain-containing protein [Streptomyces sp. NBC_01257]WSU60388.1 hemerythrin domain-containing protein [Streptomyces sp. NBC_01104]